MSDRHPRLDRTPAPQTPKPTVIREKADPLRQLNLDDERLAKALANWFKKMLTEK